MSARRRIMRHWVHHKDDVAVVDGLVVPVFAVDLSIVVTVLRIRI